MARILRGGIYWADLNPVIGSEQGRLRPVLILSHNIFNERSGTVIAVALTSQPQRAGFPLTSEISQIRTLSVKRIGNRISKADEEEIPIIIEGLNEIIGG
jgi:mRNA interferase MazF